MKLQYSASCQSPASSSSKPTPNSEISITIEDCDEKKEDVVVKSKLKRRVSVGADVERVLNILVGHGFCSRKSFNSVQQLRKFQKSSK